MVSGTDENLKMRPGVRPTLNSYMCADALAIAEFAKRLGDAEIEAKYREKHEFLKRFINEKLYEALVPALCHAIGLATQVNNWTAVAEEDMDTAIDLMFGAKGTETREKYAGLISKIQTYRKNISLRLQKPFPMMPSLSRPALAVAAQSERTRPVRRAASI